MERKEIKIVYIIDFLETSGGVIGGTERQLVEAIKRLDRSQFKPIVVALQEWVRNGEWGRLECEKKMLHVYSLKSIGTFLSFVRFVKYLKNEAPDIVLTYFFDSTIFGVLAAKAAGVKKIISCRRDMGFWQDRNLARWVSVANRFTDRWLVNCQAIKTALAEEEKIPANRIDVIHNGIDISSMTNARPAALNNEYPGIDLRGFIVGIVANFNRNVKRLDLFIEASAEVLKRRKDVTFLIIGGGRRNEARLRELVRTRGIDDHVIFGGVKEDPFPFVKTFDIGVLTSDSEGFSNTILEYMAAGVPCVVTDAGGNRELVKDGVTGVLVPTGQPAALADAIGSLLDGPGRAKSLAAEAKRMVEEKYSWDVIARKTEDYYLSLVNDES